MYKKAKVKTALLYTFGTLAVMIALGMIVFMVHTLRLRTEYRQFCLEVNDAVLASSMRQNTVTRGDETAPLSFTALPPDLRASRTAVLMASEVIVAPVTASTFRLCAS